MVKRARQVFPKFMIGLLAMLIPVLSPLNAYEEYAVSGTSHRMAIATSGLEAQDLSSTVRPVSFVAGTVEADVPASSTSPLELDSPGDTAAAVIPRTALMVTIAPLPLPLPDPLANSFNAAFVPGGIAFARPLFETLNGEEFFDGFEQGLLRAAGCDSGPMIQLLVGYQGVTAAAGLGLPMQVHERDFGYLGITLAAGVMRASVVASTGVMLYRFNFSRAEEPVFVGLRVLGGRSSIFRLRDDREVSGKISTSEEGSAYIFFRMMQPAKRSWTAPDGTVWFEYISKNDIPLAAKVVMDCKKVWKGRQMIVDEMLGWDLDEERITAKQKWGEQP